MSVQALLRKSFQAPAAKRNPISCKKLSLSRRARRDRHELNSMGPLGTATPSSPAAPCPPKTQGLPVRHANKSFGPGGVHKIPNTHLYTTDIPSMKPYPDLVLVERGGSLNLTRYRDNKNKKRLRPRLFF